MCVCVCVCVLLCLLLIRIHSRQNWIATRKHGVTRKRNRKQLKVNKKKWYSTRSDAHLLKKYLQKTQAATFLLWPKCSREAVSIGPTAYKTISVTYLTFFFNWDSLHARLNSCYEALCYKKKKHKKIKSIQKSV